MIAMKLEQEIYFKTKDSIKTNLVQLVKNRYGFGVFIKDLDLSKNSIDVPLGVYIPRIIDDTSRDQRTVKFLEFNSIGKLQIEKEKDTFKVALPNSNEIHDRIKGKMAKLLFGVETSLLETTQDKLIKISSVRLALNPIREILNEIKSKNEINLSTLLKYRDEKKVRRYISLLESLDLIKKSSKSDVIFEQGNNFIELEKDLVEHGERRLYNKLLAHTLKFGYGYIKEYLKLTSIIPYIRLSTSYYLPASESESLIMLKREDIFDNHASIYGIRPFETRASNQISQLIDDAEIFGEENNFIVGKQDILDDAHSAFVKLT